MHRWLVQSKQMTSRQLQIFCYCSVSWFQSPVQASYVWSLEVFLHVHDLYVTKITFLRGHRWFLCFGTGGLPDVPSSVLQNGGCQINTSWRRPHYFCQSFWGCRISMVSLVSLGSWERSPYFSRMHSHKLSEMDSGLWLTRAFSSCCGWSVNYKDTNSWTCSRCFNTNDIC